MPGDPEISGCTATGMIHTLHVSHVVALSSQKKMKGKFCFWMIGAFTTTRVYEKTLAEALITLLELIEMFTIGWKIE